MITSDNTTRNHTWWQQLNEQWQMAFNQAVLNRPANTEMPPDDGLELIRNAPALRFAGPTAPYPNMQFELTELSGLKDLDKLEILVVTYHQISNLDEILHLKQLKSLFINNNQISYLDGVDRLKNLEELYIQDNRIRSLAPLANLTGCHTIYCTRNLITSLDGIGEQHNTTLKKFHYLPNDGLSDALVIRFENSVGVRCLKG